MELDRNRSPNSITSLLGRASGAVPPSYFFTSCIPAWRLFWIRRCIFNLFSGSTSDRFGGVLGRSGVPSWGHFWPFWRPSCVKFGPKRVLKAYLHQKREFSPNTTPANTGAQIWTPRWPPKCPKIGPRRLQEALEDQLFRS